MARKELTKGDEFYIDAHHHKMTPKELAADLGVTLRTVQAYLRKQTPKAKQTSKAPEAGKPANKFAEHKGTVSMTAGQSEADDISSGNSPFYDTDGKPRGRNEAFYKTLENNLHIIDPDQPVR